MYVCILSYLIVILSICAYFVLYSAFLPLSHSRTSLIHSLNLNRALSTKAHIYTRELLRLSHDHRQLINAHSKVLPNEVQMIRKVKEIAKYSMCTHTVRSPSLSHSHTISVTSFFSCFFFCFVLSIGVFCVCVCMCVWLNYRGDELCLCIFLVHIRLCFQEQALLPPVSFQSAVLLCSFFVLISFGVLHLCSKKTNSNWTVENSKKA